MTAPTIDTQDFCRRADVASGSLPVAGLARLAAMLVSTQGALAWRLAGRSDLRADGSRLSFLSLGADGRLAMRCVRCLEPIDVELEVERDYRMVATEAQAELEDADEDDFDVLVSSRQLRLDELIEDEAIMALPPAPRHEDCSAPALAAGAAGDGSADPAPPNPFASLAGLRRSGAAADGEGGRSDDDDGCGTGKA
jgi:uncharacterized protein